MNAEQARELFEYDPETGLITWKKKTSKYSRALIGDVAGYLEGKTGYLRVKINHEKYYVHRIAYAIHFGAWPEGDIDHINGNRSDNRIDNIRDGSTRQNMWNLKVHRESDLTPCVRHRKEKNTNQWIAEICIGSNRNYIGSYPTKELAVLARDKYLSENNLA